MIPTWSRKNGYLSRKNMHTAAHSNGIRPVFKKSSIKNSGNTHTRINSCKSIRRSLKNTCKISSSNKSKQNIFKELASQEFYKIQSDKNLKRSYRSKTTT